MLQEKQGLLNFNPQSRDSLTILSPISFGIPIHRKYQVLNSMSVYRRYDFPSYTDIPRFAILDFASSQCKGGISIIRNGLNMADFPPKDQFSVVVDSQTYILWYSHIEEFSSLITRPKSRCTDNTIYVSVIPMPEVPHTEQRRQRQQ